MVRRLAGRLFRRLSPGTAVVVCLVVLACAIGGFVSLFAASGDADQIAIEKTIVQSAVKDALVKLGDALRPNTYWDDGYNHIADKIDPAWAEKNLGPYAQSTSNVSALFVINELDRATYEYLGGEADRNPADYEHDAAVMALVREARAKPSAPPFIATGFVEVGGRIYLGAASLLVPNDERATKPLERRNVEVYLQSFDSKKISKVQNDFHISNVVLSADPQIGNAAQITLKDASGANAAFLSWQAATPGTAFAISVAPVALASIFLIGFVLWTALRNWSATVTKLEGEKLEAVQARSEELRLSAQRAEEASEAKSTFLAMMSHEIRTPMNGVLGLANVLLESNLDEEQRSQLMTIRESGESLLDIINDLLDFSKLEAGRIDVEDVAFDFDAMLCHAVEVVEPRASGKGIVLQFDIDPKAPKYLRGDPGRVRQVVLNLLSNAIKFTDSGSVRLKAIAVAQDEAAATLRVEVTDTGIGLSDDQIGKLFQTFSQADSSISRRFGGTGLGLAICRRIVERMGGTIGVKSRPGKGSTFWFELTLPIARQAEVSASHSRVAPEELDAALAAIKALRRPYRLLVAEDNPTNQLVVKAMLAKVDIVPEFAGNGVEAIAAVRTKSYDCVLMDLQMPEMGGIEATDAIRSMQGGKGSVPIVALTANTQAKHVEACKDAGMNGYLAKPFHKEDLLLALAGALQGKAWLNRAPAGDRPPEPPVAGPVDWELLERFRAGNGDDMFEILIDTFVSDAAQKVAQLNAMLRDKQTGEETIRLAHSLKSASAMAGAPQLSRLMADVEARLEADETADLSADADAAVAMFNAYAAAVKAKAAA